jgi:hypothetical protein
MKKYRNQAVELSVSNVTAGSASKDSDVNALL